MGALLAEGRRTPRARPSKRSVATAQRSASAPFSHAPQATPGCASRYGQPQDLRRFRARAFHPKWQQEDRKQPKTRRRDQRRVARRPEASRSRSLPRARRARRRRSSATAPASPLRPPPSAALARPAQPRKASAQKPYVRPCAGHSRRSVTRRPPGGSLFELCHPDGASDDHIAAKPALPAGTCSAVRAIALKAREVSLCPSRF